MNHGGATALRGGVGVEIIRKDRWVPDPIAAFNPRSGLGKYIRECLQYLPAQMAAELVNRVSRVVVLESSLWAVLLPVGRPPEPLGLLSQKVVTTAGVNFIVDAFQNIVELENMKYHGLGTGNTAENVADTALVTELTTEYNPNSTRATGTTIEGASANIFRTVATNTVDAAAAIVEHGIFSQAATGGGVLLDRSVFSVVNLANGDSLQTTYDLTCSAGG